MNMRTRKEIIEDAELSLREATAFNTGVFWARVFGHLKTSENFDLSDLVTALTLSTIIENVKHEQRNGRPFGRKVAGTDGSPDERAPSVGRHQVR